MPDREKVIKGLEFTKAMITFNPSTGEDIEPENLNEANKTTYYACVGAIALLKEQEESIPLKPLCKWLAGYAAPPGNASWLALYGSLEKAWEHELKELFTS